MATSEHGRKDSRTDGWTRRDLLRGAGVAAAAGAVLGPASVASGADAPGGVRTQGPGAVEIALRVNGQERRVSVEPRHTLLEVLRLPLDLTGAKSACDRATCGACTVLIDGLPVYACAVLALDAEGRDVVTAEGIAASDGRSLVEAFVAKDAMQCGYCTPGMLVSCHAAVAAHGPGLTEEQAREATSGNLCRCGTYPHVLAAALGAATSAKGR
jgi:aerobic-type carbon monoxide dehydrogenase small subunit (CoxS/CutS family)